MKGAFGDMDVFVVVDCVQTDAVVEDVFAEFGAASNQIGKTYPMLASLNPNSRSVLRALKKELDPEGLINPGALGDFSA